MGSGRYLPQRPPRRGLALARQIGMLSYKSAPLFEERFGRKTNRNGEDPWAPFKPGRGAFRADASILPVILTTRATHLLTVSMPMPTWPSCGPWTHGIRCSDTPRRQEAFGRIRARLSFGGISTDWCFPAAMVREFAEAVRAAGARADYREMISDHGHDAFLAEQADLVRLLQ